MHRVSTRWAETENSLSSKLWEKHKKHPFFSFKEPVSSGGITPLECRQGGGGGGVFPRPFICVTEGSCSRP
jgi:hypothetical protein